MFFSFLMPLWFSHLLFFSFHTYYRAFIYALSWSSADYSSYTLYHPRRQNCLFFWIIFPLVARKWKSRDRLNSVIFIRYRGRWALQKCWRSLLSQAGSFRLSLRLRWFLVYPSPALLDLPTLSGPWHLQTHHFSPPALSWFPFTPLPELTSVTDRMTPDFGYYFFICLIFLTSLPTQLMFFLCLSRKEN